MSLSGLQSNNVGDDFYSHITGQERGRWICVEGAPMGVGLFSDIGEHFTPTGDLFTEGTLWLYTPVLNCYSQHVLGNLPIGGIASITRSLTHLTATRRFRFKMQFMHQPGG